jgi:hypothetical protein
VQDGERARIAIEWHSELFSELNLKPWEWPAVRAPNTACPEEPGSLAEAHWCAAVKRWQLLAATARNVMKDFNLPARRAFQ